MQLLYFLGLFAVAFAVEYSEDALKDEVVDLPGLNDDISFRQFSGYLTISESGKNIHYWFTESENDPENDPVVFWTNGGPGCSGLLGFMTEMGAFRPQEDLSLELNDWRWNKIANMVYIEQPAGVGFSYSDDTSDYRTGDQQAAQDNYQTLLAFFERFDALADNPMYITSESYGGHYMPTLAKTIVEANNSDLNFKGFAVGNPYTDFYSGSGAMLDTYWGHQLLAKPTWDKFQTNCADPKTAASNSNLCSALSLKLNQQVGNLNPYALDYPVCTSSAESKSGHAQRLWLMNYILPDHLKQDMASSEDYEPCGDNYATSYLNQAEVKDAIHVKSDITWAECSYTLRYEYGDEMIPMQPLYKQLLAENNDLDILVYSGDDDSVCATVGTQSWIYDLGYDTSSLWKVWTVEGQVAGYQTQFEVDTNNQFAFITVHGAGHEVPTYQPEQAFVLFQSYLDGSVFEGLE